MSNCILFVHFALYIFCILCGLFTLAKLCLLGVYFYYTKSILHEHLEIHEKHTKSIQREYTFCTKEDIQKVYLYSVRVLSKIHLSKTGCSWYKSLTAIILKPPNGLLVSVICWSLRFRKLNIPLPTIEISSINITCNFRNCVLMVFSPSLSNVQ